MRCPRFSPSPIESHFIENPIVYFVEGVYVVIYDVDIDDPHAVGYAFSGDGLHWSQGKRFPLQQEANFNMRTPISLIAEGDGTYSLFYTAIDKDYRKRGSAQPEQVENVYLATVRIERGGGTAKQ